MRKSRFNLRSYTLITCTTLLFACTKNNGVVEKQASLTTENGIAHSSIKTQASGSVLLNVDYETGTTNSGITGVNPTNATASDAVYMVSPGRNGNYAVAHKVTLGLPGYFSNDAYRSESDADNIPAARFASGDERRYEFSVYLKDWEQWNSSNPPYGDNLFQCKITSGASVPIRILTKRNSIVTRTGATAQDNLVTDFRPYINQWIDFRIDVLWSNTTTGYLKIYTRYPGEQNYTIRLQRLNTVTYTGTAAQHGYIKWGVYREAGTSFTDNALTRIAYHDDVKITALN
ncbi:heparin lyase I family protein [Pedobacter arcticus]|uniref:heparin lyase I family protein n=1 Tax=Pedobacter arcticus TaxID=752140 RepID=UPI0002DA5F68|nr:heparin lyase I family protein [Pedobacter arcticus]